jgi:hypothetical protein
LQGIWKYNNAEQSVAVFPCLRENLSEDSGIMGQMRLQQLIRLKGIEALGPKPATGKPAPGRRIRPRRWARSDGPVRYDLFYYPRFGSRM